MDGRKIIDLSVASTIVILVMLVIMPLYFPNSGIDPLGLNKKTAAPTETAEPSANPSQVPTTSKEGKEGKTAKPSKKPESSPKETAKPSKKPEPTPKETKDPQSTKETTPSQNKSNLNSKLTLAIMFLVAVLIIGVGVYILIYYIRLYTYKNIAAEMVYFKVMPASDFKISSMAYSKYFLINLSKHMQSPWDPMFLATPWCRIIYHKKVEDGNVETIIGIPKDRTDGFISAFKAYYPKVQLIEYFEIYQDSEGNRYRITSPTELLDDTNFGVTEFRLRQRFGLNALSPIKMFSKKPDEVDPMETILASMGAGEAESDEVFIDITLKPVWSKYHLYDKGKKFVNKVRGNTTDNEEISSILNSAADELLNSKKGGKTKKRPMMTEFTRGALAAVKQKCSAPERAYATNIRIYIRCANPEHIIMKLKGVVDGFEPLSSGNELETDNIFSKKKLWERIYHGFPHPMSKMILSTAELVSFVRIVDSDSPIFIFTDHNDTMAIRAPSGFWEDETTDYLTMD